MKNSILAQIEELSSKIEGKKARLTDYRQMDDLLQQVLAEQLDVSRRAVEQAEKWQARCDLLENRLLAELETSTSLSIMLLSGQRNFDVTARC